MPMNARLLRPRASGFNPRSISGLAGWWDASDTSAVTTVSGAVSQLNDKSGFNRHATQGTANNRPSYSGTINGRNVMTLDGANDRLVTGLESNTLTEYASFLAVFEIDSGETASSAANKPVLHGRDSGTLANAYGMAFSIISSQLVLNQMWRGSGFGLSSAPVIAIGSPQIAVVSIAASSHIRRINGAGNNGSLAMTAGTGSAAGNFLHIGTDPPNDLNRYFKGKIGECLVFSRTLTLSEVRTLEAWLGRKWGITV